MSERYNVALNGLIALFLSWPLMIARISLVVFSTTVTGKGHLIWVLCFCDFSMLFRESGFADLLGSLFM